MSQSDKIRVAVLFGGRSAEHEISLQSAANVIEYFDTSRFDVIPIGIDREGKWFLEKDIFTHSLARNNVQKNDEQMPAWFTPEWIGSAIEKAPFSHYDLPKRENGQVFDVVFPAVHGTYCEDGTLQGLLELANLPYVGCGVLSSAINMDKDVSKRLASLAGIPIAPYRVIRAAEWHYHADELVQAINRDFSFPVFVKPANTGSSIGITKAKSVDELRDAITAALSFDSKILIEKALTINELEVAVLESLDEGQDPIVSVVGEIKPLTHEFYSYEAKYADAAGTELLIPATVSPAMQAQCQQIAKKLFAVLECEGMARVDLFYDKDSKQIVFNEINTLPGFTRISMYPKLLAATGIGYTELLTHLIELAIKRHQNKSKLMRSITV